MGKFSRCGFEFQERRGPLRGADVVRAVQAAPAYMNRGLRSLHSLTPGYNPSLLFSTLCERGRITQHLQI